ncbi:conserved hypothetical protein [Neospora caninum Liverpool]|uniref:Uncharacterized protein n=1 Tax=Neospora caninum (strain Liverpool) TaxID=572307 RepID=F0VGG7_NEOCL|nr:conserved hypothetical protein [Neospora caninum Liverpool]CBZ52811.1 conserved hypothetical protein [Neospora caninum Liverpool]CEL66792.1 TPA: hypothetical protein BN1204_026000 [Neospora caninum Liverpool]|eukprot:XP_003882843.1 conserved hypothetical protein [Neospora caninum Liverpool]
MRKNGDGFDRGSGPGGDEAGLAASPLERGVPARSRKSSFSAMADSRFGACASRPLSVSPPRGDSRAHASRPSSPYARRAFHAPFSALPYGPEIPYPPAFSYLPYAEEERERGKKCVLTASKYPAPSQPRIFPYRSLPTGPDMSFAYASAGPFPFQPVRRPGGTCTLKPSPSFLSEAAVERSGRPRNARRGDRTDGEACGDTGRRDGENSRSRSVSNISSRSASSISPPSSSSSDSSRSSALRPPQARGRKDAECPEAGKRPGDLGRSERGEREETEAVRRDFHARLASGARRNAGRKEGRKDSKEGRNDVEGQGSGFAASPSRPARGEGEAPGRGAREAGPARENEAAVRKEEKVAAERRGDSPSSSAKPTSEPEKKESNERPAESTHASATASGSGTELLGPFAQGRPTDSSVCLKEKAEGGGGSSCDSSGDLQSSVTLASRPPLGGATSVRRSTSPASKASSTSFLSDCEPALDVREKDRAPPRRFRGRSPSPVSVGRRRTPSPLSPVGPSFDPAACRGFEDRHAALCRPSPGTHREDEYERRPFAGFQRGPAADSARVLSPSDFEASREAAPVSRTFSPTRAVALPRSPRGARGETFLSRSPSRSQSPLSGRRGDSTRSPTRPAARASEASRAARKCLFTDQGEADSGDYLGSRRGGLDAEPSGGRGAFHEVSKGSSFERPGRAYPATFASFRDEEHSRRLDLEDRSFSAASARPASFASRPLLPSDAFSRPRNLPRIIPPPAVFPAFGVNSHGSPFTAFSRLPPLLPSPEAGRGRFPFAGASTPPEIRFGPMRVDPREDAREDCRDDRRDDRRDEGLEGGRRSRPAAYMRRRSVSPFSASPPSMLVLGREREAERVQFDGLEDERRGLRRRERDDQGPVSLWPLLPSPTSHGFSPPTRGDPFPAHARGFPASGSDRASSSQKPTDVWASASRDRKPSLPSSAGFERRRGEHSPSIFSCRSHSPPSDASPTRSRARASARAALEADENAGEGSERAGLQRLASGLSLERASRARDARERGPRRDEKGERGEGRDGEFATDGRRSRSLLSAPEESEAGVSGRRGRRNEDGREERRREDARCTGSSRRREASLSPFSTASRDGRDRRERAEAGAFPERRSARGREKERREENAWEDREKARLGKENAPRSATSRRSSTSAGKGGRRDEGRRERRRRRLSCLSSVGSENGEPASRDRRVSTSSCVHERKEGRRLRSASRSPSCASRAPRGRRRAREGDGEPSERSRGERDSPEPQEREARLGEARSVRGRDRKERKKARDVPDSDLDAGALGAETRKRERPSCDERAHKREKVDRLVSASLSSGADDTRAARTLSRSLSRGRERRKRQRSQEETEGAFASRVRPERRSLERERDAAAAGAKRASAQRPYLMMRRSGDEDETEEGNACAEDGDPQRKVDIRKKRVARDRDALDRFSRSLSRGEERDRSSLAGRDESRREERRRRPSSRPASLERRSPFVDGEPPGRLRGQEREERGRRDSPRLRSPSLSREAATAHGAAYKETESEPSGERRAERSSFSRLAWRGGEGDREDRAHEERGESCKRNARTSSRGRGSRSPSLPSSDARWSPGSFPSRFGAGRRGRASEDSEYVRGRRDDEKFSEERERRDREEEQRVAEGDRRSFAQTGTTSYRLSCRGEEAYRTAEGSARARVREAREDAFDREEVGAFASAADQEDEREETERRGSEEGDRTRRVKSSFSPPRGERSGSTVLGSEPGKARLRTDEDPFRARANFGRTGPFHGGEPSGFSPRDRRPGDTWGLPRSRLPSAGGPEGDEERRQRDEGRREDGERSKMAERRRRFNELKLSAFARRSPSTCADARGPGPQAGPVEEARARRSEGEDAFFAGESRDKERPMPGRRPEERRRVAPEEQGLLGPPPAFRPPQGVFAKTGRLGNDGDLQGGREAHGFAQGHAPPGSRLGPAFSFPSSFPAFSPSSAPPLLPCPASSPLRNAGGPSASFDAFASFPPPASLGDQGALPASSGPLRSSFSPPSRPSPPPAVPAAFPQSPKQASSVHSQPAQPQPQPRLQREEKERKRARTAFVSVSLVDLWTGKIAKTCLGRIPQIIGASAQDHVAFLRLFRSRREANQRWAAAMREVRQREFFQGLAALESVERVNAELQCLSQAAQAIGAAAVGTRASPTPPSGPAESSLSAFGVPTAFFSPPAVSGHPAPLSPSGTAKSAEEEKENGRRKTSKSEDAGAAEAGKSE